MKVKTRVDLYVGQAILEYENKGGGYDVVIGRVDGKF